MNGSEARLRETPGESSPGLPYEAPAIIFERAIEAVANTCGFDPPTTKQNVGDGCTGLTFS